MSVNRPNDQVATGSDQTQADALSSVNRLEMYAAVDIGKISGGRTPVESGFPPIEVGQNNAQGQWESAGG